jgi:hypothetical protein
MYTPYNLLIKKVGAISCRISGLGLAFLRQAFNPSSLRLPTTFEK